MKPDGVVNGQLLVYSQLSPGSSTGCSPTTPGPRTSCSLPRLSVMRQRLAASRCQHGQEVFSGPARAVGIDRLDADMIGAGVPMLLNPLADRRLASPGDIGVDETLRPAAGKILIGKAEPPPIVDVIVEPHVRAERLAGGGPRLFGIALQQDPNFRA